MISNSKIAEIERLLLAGMSQRKIASISGVSRGVICAIYSGKRRRNPEREYKPDSVAPVRCPSCGALAAMPCIACRDRNGLKKAKKTTHFNPSPENLQIGLELRPEHQARLEQVRAARRKNQSESGPILASFSLLEEEESDPADRAA